jgi:hypothetical protein
MLQVFVAIFQKFCYRKEAWDYAKIIHKKREKKVEKMDTKVFEIFKIMGT